MTKVTNTSNRKADHIRINLEEDVDSSLTTGLEKYRFVHQALPELDLDAVDLSQPLFGRHLDAPILAHLRNGVEDSAVAMASALFQNPNPRQPRLPGN